MATIHKPQHLNSSIGLGTSNAINKSEFLGNTVIVTTLFWQPVEKPWQQSNKIIAQDGFKWISRWELNKPYILTKVFDDANKFVGIYADICSPIIRDGISFICNDHYLDVWKAADDNPQILDEDELTQAVSLKYLTEREAQQAKATSLFLFEILGSNQQNMI